MKDELIRNNRSGTEVLKSGILMPLISNRSTGAENISNSFQGLQPEHVIETLPGESKEQFEYRRAVELISQTTSSRSLYEEAHTHPSGSWLQVILRQSADALVRGQVRGEAMAKTKRALLAELKTHAPISHGQQVQTSNDGSASQHPRHGKNGSWTKAMKSALSRSAFWKGAK